MNILSNIPQLMTECEALANEAIGKDKKAISKTDAKKLAKEYNVPFSDIEAHARECFNILKAEAPCQEYVMAGMDKQANPDGVSSLAADRRQFEMVNPIIAEAQNAANAMKTEFQTRVLNDLGGYCYLSSAALTGAEASLDKHFAQAKADAVSYIEKVKAEGWKTEGWKAKHRELKRKSYSLNLQRLFIAKLQGKVAKSKWLPDVHGSELIGLVNQPKQFETVSRFWLGVMSQLQKHHAQG